MGGIPPVSRWRGRAIGPNSGPGFINPARFSLPDRGRIGIQRVPDPTVGADLVLPDPLRAVSVVPTYSVTGQLIHRLRIAGRV